MTALRVNVPTHLDTADGVGGLTIRQMFLLIGTTMFVAPLGFMYGPAVGPSLADGLIGANEFWKYLVNPGTLRAGTMLATLAPFAGAGALALPLDPPIEHGAVSWAKYRIDGHDIGPKDLEELRGNPKVERNVVHAYGRHVAMWELPSVTMRLASIEAREAELARWASFLDGIPCPIQVSMRCTPVDLKSVLKRMSKDPNPNGARVANYLSASTSLGGEIQRVRYLSIWDSDEDQLRDYAQDVDAALGRSTIGGHRLEGEDLQYATLGAWYTPNQDGRFSITSVTKSAAARVEDDAIKVGGEWLSALALHRWPSSVGVDFLDGAYDGDWPVDVTQTITPLAKVDIRRYLEGRLQRLTSTSENRQRKEAIKQLNHTLDQLETNTERFFEVEVLFVVRDKTRAGVRAKRRRVVQYGFEIGGEVHELRWEHKAGIVSASGLGESRIYNRRHRVDTSSLSRMYPLSASELGLDGGVPWGLTLSGNRRVTWTPWARPKIPNPHLAMYATSGAGKGFAVKVIDSRLFFAGQLDEGYYLDQAEEGEQGEYLNFAQYLGGESRPVNDLSDLDAALAGIEEGRPQPRVVVLYTAKLGSDERCVVLIRLKRALFKRAAAREARYRFGADETWSYAGSFPAVTDLTGTSAERELEDVVRRGRHLKIAGVFQTQRPADALDSKIGRLIQSQCASQWVGIQLPAEITDVAGRLRWTQEQTRAISRFGQGDGMLTAGNHSVTFHVDYTQDEWAAFNTDGTF